MRPGKLQAHSTINHTKGVCCLSSTSSFPEDCARLKLSSARASQAGLKEMMMQMKSKRFNEQCNETTMCVPLYHLPLTAGIIILSLNNQE